MCKMASFFHRKTDGMGLEIKVWDLCGHGETQEHLKLTDKAGWFEGHYLPDGEVVCRIPDGEDKERAEEVKRRYPTFNAFLQWCFTQEINTGGSLDLRDCDLKGIKLPDSIGGWLDLGCCDLKGIKLPDSIGGSLDLSGCDLKGIKLPDSIGGRLYLRGCDLKGIKLPDSIGGSLYLSGCTNIPKKLPKVKDKIYRD